MAAQAQLDHLFSYGPLDVVASNDEKKPGLHIVHVDAENSAFIPQEDPLQQEIRSLIDKNPHSKGFVANQIHARIEQEGKWQGPGHDVEGLSFSPSLGKEQGQAKADVASTQKMEVFPAQNVDLPDDLKEKMDFRAVVQPLVLRDGIQRLTDEVQPDDVLKGYAARGISDETPDSDSMDGWHRLFPGGKQQTFGVNDLDKARAAAQDLAANAVINFDSVEAAYRESSGLADFGRNFKRDSDGLKNWNAAKEQHVGKQAETPELAQPEPDKKVEAQTPDDPAKKQDQAPQQKMEPDPLADWPSVSKKGSEPLMAPEKPQFERKNPPEILFSNPKGKPYVLDHGDKVSVTNRAMLGLGREAAEKRHKAVEIGLKTAVDRFGEPVRFHGNRAFLEETVKVAMERGVALEPGSPMAKEIYERAIKEHGNQLGPSRGASPSKAAPYRAPEKKQEVDKGKGIGL